MGHAPEGEPRNSDHAQQDLFEKLSRIIRESSEQPGLAENFELVLSQAGLIEPLEEAGLLPVPKNLNPYDPEFQEAENLQWGKEHPTETATFIADYESRDKALQLLYIGFAMARAMKPGAEEL